MPKSGGAGTFNSKSKDKKKESQEKFDDINKPYDPKSKYEEKYKEPQEINFAPDPVPETKNV